MPTIDLAQDNLRTLNQTLQQAARDVAASSRREEKGMIWRIIITPRDGTTLVKQRVQRGELHKSVT